MKNGALELRISAGQPSCTIFVTRSGWASASRKAQWPPIELPMTDALFSPKASITDDRTCTANCLRSTCR